MTEPQRPDLERIEAHPGRAADGDVHALAVWTRHLETALERLGSMAAVSDDAIGALPLSAEMANAELLARIDYARTALAAGGSA